MILTPMSVCLGFACAQAPVDARSKSTSIATPILFIDTSVWKSCIAKSLIANVVGNDYYRIRIHEFVKFYFFLRELWRGLPDYFLNQRQVLTIVNVVGNDT